VYFSCFFILFSLTQVHILVTVSNRVIFMLTLTTVVQRKPTVLGLLGRMSYTQKIDAHKLFHDKMSGD